MLRAKHIWVVGGDPRQAALARLLADREPGVLLCPLAALPDRLTEG